jgi:hypothetical protein
MQVELFSFDRCIDENKSIGQEGMRNGEKSSM